MQVVACGARGGREGRALSFERRYCITLEALSLSGVGRRQGGRGVRRPPGPALT